MDKCKWVARPGLNNSYWAFTPCLRGFNYLSKVSRAKDVKRVYENRLCHICGKPISINVELLDEVEYDNRRSDKYSRRI